ncbi:hypothetical protein [Streptomyces sp. NPDC093225]|uniref:hypothetical protein n=1 Tax=Streptomyces sp. NPDC093225 TaxID=3366034 RepID=UPI00380F6290
MRTEEDVRDLPPFVIKRIKNSHDWDRFLITQAQRYLVRALPEAKARTVYGDLTRAAASLDGKAQALKPKEVFARMEPLLDTFSDIEDLCPPPRPIHIRWPKPHLERETAGPLPDPWLVLGPLPDPWFADVTPVRALPVLEALDSLAGEFSDSKTGALFREALAGARAGIG